MKPPKKNRTNAEYAEIGLEIAEIFKRREVNELESILVMSLIFQPIQGDIIQAFTEAYHFLQHHPDVQSALKEIEA